MRRKDKEITDRAEIAKILEECKVCRAAFADADAPYIVPLNFGWEWNGEMPTLYFHGAAEGKKMRLLAADPRVAFETDCRHRLIEGSEACVYGYAYASVVGCGRAVLVSDLEEKRRALQIFMRCQTGKEFSIDKGDAEYVTVWKIAADSITAKISPPADRSVPRPQQE